MQATVTEWLSLLSLAGLMGALGQCARVVVGLKKQGEEAAAEGVETKELISGARLLLSLAIGFAAGALSVLAVGEQLLGSQISHAMLLGFAAAGYSGADFIEGMAAKLLPQTDEAKRIEAEKTAASAGVK